MPKTLNVNGTQMESVTANGVSMNRVYMNGVLVFEKTISVTDELTIDPEAIGISSDQQSYTINVFSNLDWDVSEQLSEASLSASSGSGNGTITVTVLENKSSSERVRSFSFYAGDLIVTHTFTQEAAPEPAPEPEPNPDPFRIDPTINEVNAGISTYHIEVISSSSWSVVNSLEWINVNPKFGSNNATVTVGVSSNQSTDFRTGTFTFTTGSETVTHQVNQFGQQGGGGNTGGGGSTPPPGDGGGPTRDNGDNGDNELEP
jgi:hypothetical protein